MRCEEITDLRSALAFLKTLEGQYHETDVEVSPEAALAGVYRYIGGGGTVMRPTKTGPAMVFNNIKGFPDSRVAIGIVGSRERVGCLLGTPPDRLGFRMNEALRHPIDPVPVESGPCQEVVHRATDPGFDIRTLLPAPTNTPDDAGPYITMGLVYAEDPENGDQDVTIHRQCLQSADEISMYFVPGRHIDHFRQKAEARGEALPITVNIGLDPAVYLASCFEPPTTPLGFNELRIAGGLRGRAVELCPAVSVSTKAIAHAEIVIEGELLPGKRVQEDQHTLTGHAMPEFPGYNGPANPAVPVFKVKAVTHRVRPIMQTTIGPSEEHVSLAGIPTEASIIQMVERAMPGRLQNVYAHSCGGGKLTAVLQFKKLGPSDEGRQRQAALVAFAAFPELKNIILVDEDVDPFDSNDVLWAMTTRMQGDVDIVTIPGVRCHPLDPSQRPDMSPSIIAEGISCKTLFDCTVPVAMRDHFRRAQFLEIDPTPYL
ncbi:Carboxylyase-related protein [Pseudodesulfovibrio mercurii]|uniref:Carboxylyase-related protein n=1 Tax=Pseudodesulfovibrio mercurii TaxID=641491 RepID=F0JC29_9BACT|nr:UbiD family decarboxylase [Pseudodesulfovibrio mercurii]EGB15602.1 Carboxylyase-related protein [Pseudodesulfovibrio mercurii]